MLKSVGPDLFWIDAKINNEENLRMQEHFRKTLNELEGVYPKDVLDSGKVKFFESVEDSFPEIQKSHMVVIIVSG